MVKLLKQLVKALKKWLGNFSPPCTNKLRRQFSGLIGPPFLALNDLLWLDRRPLAESCDYRKFVTEWVWLGSIICTWCVRFGA